MVSGSTEINAQPNGLELGKTLHIVNEILTNPTFCEEVKKEYGWPIDMGPDRAALLFLTMRCQWAVEGLTLRTDTLKRETEGCMNRIVALEDRVFTS